jgi:hypothetical protein
MGRSNNKKTLFHTDYVDDEMYMCADLRIEKSFKDGLKICFERQNSITVSFIIYTGGLIELSNFLNKHLSNETIKTPTNK